ncbi:uncharacterized protein LOC114280180 [Camellia sinensis]|uniref:uncharacterized protein LOC114280180 n=1 Tax=Camellia sinensis TaxID=4442 RepID=UPI00103603F9|nr:uncharacterized protein LOC114280180 [Camellia sinensis]
MKNAFLHGDLEEVYMDIQPGFSSQSIVGKVCRLKKALYVVTGNDEEEVTHLKMLLAKEFEIKDLGSLRYFLGIEVVRSDKGIFISQRKYILDLLKETGVLGCRPADSPIEANHHLCSGVGDLVEKERYQGLVGRLIYLSHTHPDIAYEVGIMS